MIDVEERYDPYDRSIQLVPVVKQERGALRWLGDVIFNSVDTLRDSNSARPNFGQKLTTPSLTFGQKGAVMAINRPNFGRNLNFCPNTLEFA